MNKIPLFGVVLLAAVALLFSACSAPVRQDQQNEATESRAEPAPRAEEPAEEVPAENADRALVGGDRDEHGCIGSAGYTWCEPKEKCLRLWEEQCYASLEEELEHILAAKHERLPDETKVTITKRSADGNYVSGGVMFGAGGPGEGGMLLAARIDNVWQVVFDGNGNPDCEQLRDEYNFPDEILKPNYCN